MQWTDEHVDTRRVDSDENNLVEDHCSTIAHPSLPVMKIPKAEQIQSSWLKFTHLSVSDAHV